VGEDQLEQLGKELTESIQRAKAVALGCKMGHY
jgi:hypothetical protein